MTFEAQFPSICAARKSCSDCRTRPAWRELYGAPKECPFVTEAVEVISHVPVLIVATVEESLSYCRACPKLNPSQRCIGCGCASEKPREISDIRICPEKKWLRRTETKSEDRGASS